MMTALVVRSLCYYQCQSSVVLAPYFSYQYDLSAMGSCCSYIKREDSFEEVERRKSKDLAVVNARRKSSGLSRYSSEGKHVLEEPLRIAAFNVRKFGAKKMKDPTTVDILGSNNH